MEDGAPRVQWLLGELERLFNAKGDIRGGMEWEGSERFRRRPKTWSKSLNLEASTNCMVGVGCKGRKKAVLMGTRRGSKCGQNYETRRS